MENSSTFKSESMNTDTEELSSYEDESDSIDGFNKEEIDELIQESLKTFKKELLESEDLKPLLDASREETLVQVRKEFDKEELEKIILTNFES